MVLSLSSESNDDEYLEQKQTRRQRRILPYSVTKKGFAVFEKYIMKNLAKIMEKYTKPNIPTTEGVLEDLFDDEVLQVKDHPIKVAEGNESLLDAHSCFINFKQLQEDVMKQDGLNSKLDELNQKLAENIANLKGQR